MFETLDDSTRVWPVSASLLGGETAGNDWRLFTTLLALRRRLPDPLQCSIPSWSSTSTCGPTPATLYQWPGLADTVDFDEIRTHYYLITE